MPITQQATMNYYTIISFSQDNLNLPIQEHWCLNVHSSQASRLTNFPAKRLEPQTPNLCLTTHSTFNSIHNHIDSMKRPVQKRYTPLQPSRHQQNIRRHLPLRTCKSSHDEGDVHTKVESHPNIHTLKDRYIHSRD